MLLHCTIGLNLKELELVLGGSATNAQMGKKDQLNSQGTKTAR